MKFTTMKKGTSETWIKGGNAGGIHTFNSDNTYEAFTATQSKKFKTYIGSVKYLQDRGYKKA